MAWSILNDAFLRLPDGDSVLSRASQQYVADRFLLWGQENFVHDQRGTEDPTP